MDFPSTKSGFLCLLYSLSLLLLTVCNEFVGRCSENNSVNVTLEDVQRYGVCEAYAGEAAPCNSVFHEGVDYIYIPYTRTLGNQRLLSSLINDTTIILDLLPMQCIPVAIKILCTFYFIPCGNTTTFQPPVSVCPEECLYLRNDLCPTQWEQALLYFAGRQDLIAAGLNLIDCNNSGQILEPLSHCCTNAGVTLPSSPSPSPSPTPTPTPTLSIEPRPTATFVVTDAPTMDDPNTLIIAVSAGVGGELVVCALVAATVTAAVARAKMRKDGKTAHVPDIPILQEPPPVSPRGRTSHPFGKYDLQGGIGMLSTHDNRYGEAPAHGRDPKTRVPSTYLRRMSGQMLIPSHCIDLMDCVGQGEFGVVYRAHLNGWEDEPSQIVAVKTLKVMSSMSDIAELLDESLKMKSFAHPNVLNLIGVCVDAGPAPYVVMPYMANGSLLHYLRKERPHLTIAEGAEPELINTAQRKLLPMCLQIAKGMEYLAKEKFVHRDLAARNCMIDSGGVIKVADFGLSEDIYSRNYFRQGSDDAGVRLPIRWMALESLQDGIFSEKSDVWSFGVTCWEIYSLGRTPYPGLVPFSLIKFLEAGQRLEKPTNAACTDEIYSTVLRCWCGDVDKRPPFSELVMDIATALEAIAGYMDFSCVSIVDMGEEEGHPYDHLAQEEDT